MNYDLILSTMKEKFVSLSGINPDDASDIGIRLKLMAGEFLAIYKKMEFVKNQIFPQTASDEFLEMHGKNRNIFPLHARKAKGVVTFYRQSPAPSDIHIPKGTIVSCSSIDNSPSYQKDEEAFISKNSISTDVSVTATEGGFHTNLSANKIDTIVSSVTGVNSVKNSLPISGGQQKESMQSFRKRLLDSFINIPTAINLSFFEDFAINNPLVSSAKARFSDSSNIIELFITDTNRNIPSNIINKISNDIIKFRPINTKIVVKPAEKVYLNCNCVLFITDTNRNIPSNIINKISNDIIKFRPINTKIVVKPAEKVYLNCNCVIYLSTDLNEEEASESAIKSIKKYISELAIGEYFSPYNIAPYLLSITGVIDYKFQSPLAPVQLNHNQVFSPGNEIEITCERR